MFALQYFFMSHFTEGMGGQSTLIEEERLPKTGGRS